MPIPTRLLACVAAGAAVLPAQDQPRAARPLHAAYDAILAATVRDERIDHLQVRDRHFTDLVAYRDRIAQVDRTQLDRDEHLALLINLYNATMIRTVCERFVAGWTPATRDFAVFDEPLVGLGERRISLDELEHEHNRRVAARPSHRVARRLLGAQSGPAVG